MIPAYCQDPLSALLLVNSIRQTGVVRHEYWTSTLFARTNVQVWLVPFNIRGNHWVLFVLSREHAVIRIYDSTIDQETAYRQRQSGAGGEDDSHRHQSDALREMMSTAIVLLRHFCSDADLLGGGGGGGGGVRNRWQVELCPYGEKQKYELCGFYVCYTMLQTLFRYQRDGAVGLYTGFVTVSTATITAYANSLGDTLLCGWIQNKKEDQHTCLKTHRDLALLISIVTALQALHRGDVDDDDTTTTYTCTILWDHLDEARTPATAEHLARAIGAVVIRASGITMRKNITYGAFLVDSESSLSGQIAVCLERDSGGDDDAVAKNHMLVPPLVLLIDRRAFILEGAAADQREWDDDEDDRDDPIE